MLPSLATMASGLGSDLFVGRERELAVLAEHAAAAAAGRAGLVLVTGPQGAGKTRLVSEACAAARAGGAAVVEASCWDEPGAPAYAPWVQVVDALRRLCAADPVERLSPLERTALAPLTLQAVDDLRPVDPAHAHFLLQRATADVVRTASAQQPLVLAIDDLHAADPSSLRLLSEVLGQARDARLLVLATVRGDEDDGRLQRLRRTAEVLVVAGLDRPAVDRYVTARLPDAEAELRTWLWQTTDGNPLFLRELVALPDARRTGAFPETVASAVRRRVAALCPQTRRVVDMAAVLGRDVSLPALAAALELPAEQLLQRLDDTLRQGVLVSDRSPAQLRFAHGLFREVLLGDLGLSCRPMHERAARVLEQLHGQDPDRAADIAEQYYRALPLGDPVKAWVWAVRAADRAVSRLSFADAATLLAQAAEAQALAGEGAATRSRLLDRLGDAEFRAGRLVPARQAWRAAAELARAAGDPAALAAAALGLGRELEWGRMSRERLELLEEALAADVPPATRVHLLARLATELYWTPQRERRQQLSGESLDLARQLTDPAAVSAALRGALWAFRDADTSEQRIRMSEELLSVAGDDPETLEEGRYHRIVALLETGALEAAFADIDAHEQLAERVQHPVYLWRSQMWGVMRLQLAGRVAQAREAAIRTRRLGEEVGERNAALIYPGQAAENERWTTWSAGTGQLLSALADELPAIPLLRCVVALIESDVRPVEAMRLLDRLVDPDALPFDSSWLASHVWLADACEVLGATEHAAALLPRLRPYAPQWLVSGGGATYQGPVVSLLGSLELTAGHPETAVPLLQQGLSLLEAAGAPVLAAVDGVRLGTALRLQGLPDEGVLAASLESARSLGLTRLLQRPLPNLPSGSYHRGPGGVLTPRELEVLALLADGRSNREIAGALFVTEKTVKTHVSGVLAKLHCTDRTQAALYAVRHGLVLDR